MKQKISNYSPWYITGLMTVLILFTEIMHADSFLYEKETQPSNLQCSLAANDHSQASHNQLLSVSHNVGVQCSKTPAENI